MQRIVIPSTDLNTSRLGFGTASLHHALLTRDRQSLLRAALDAGITHFDTARIYGEGMAERELGHLLGKSRHQVTIATKVGIPAIRVCEMFPPLLYAHRGLGALRGRLRLGRPEQRRRDLTPESAECSLTSSLKALRTDWVDILFIHDPQPSEVEDLLRLAEWLRRQKSSGRVRYLGLSGAAKHCVAIGMGTGQLFDILQIEDSLIGREADAVMKAERSIQISFGYIRRAKDGQDPSGSEKIMSEALVRNRFGMVLFSSRRPERVRAVAALAE